MHALRVTNSYTQTHKHTYTHSYTYTHTYTYIYSDTHTPKYTRIHIRYTRRHILSQTYTHTESWGKQHMDATPAFPILQACLSKLLSTFRNGISEVLQKAWRSRNHTPCPQEILIWEEDTRIPMNTDKATGSKVSYDVSEVRCVRQRDHLHLCPPLPAWSSLPARSLNFRPVPKPPTPGTVRRH